MEFDCIRSRPLHIFSLIFNFKPTQGTKTYGEPEMRTQQKQHFVTREDLWGVSFTEY